MPVYYKSYCHCSQVEALKQVYDIFTDNSLDFNVRKSAAEQLATVIQGEYSYFIMCDDSVYICFSLLPTLFHRSWMKFLKTNIITISTLIKFIKSIFCCIL